MHQPTHTWVVSPGCALLAGCRCCPWHCDDMPHDALIWSCWFGHVLMPSLSLWTAWHARNSDLIMLFCDMVVAVCICEVVESDFCLSSGFGVLVMCLRITIPFSHVGVASHKSHHMTSQCIMWHHRTQEIASHKMKTHQITSRDISQLTTFTHQPQNVGSHPATNHIKTGQHTTTMERFGHRSRWSPCAHSIGKFFLWLIVFFLGNFRPRLARLYLYILFKRFIKDHPRSFYLREKSCCLFVFCFSPVPCAKSQAFLGPQVKSHSTKNVATS